MPVMSLKSWLNAERGRGISLARHLRVPPTFVTRMAKGERPVPVEHGALIEEFTGGEFSRREYWGERCERIWPDLAEDHGIQVTQALPPTTQPAGQGVAHA